MRQNPRVTVNEGGIKSLSHLQEDKEAKNNPSGFMCLTALTLGFSFLQPANAQSQALIICWTGSDQLLLLQKQLYQHWGGNKI